MTLGLAQYLNKLFFTRTLGALLAVLAILQILDLMEATDDLLARGFGLGQFLEYMGLRLPSMVQQVAPLCVLIGALLTFAQMSRANEIVAIRSTGTPIYRIVALMIPTALAFAALHLAVSELGAPPAERTLAAWMRATTPASQPAKPDKPVWFRIGDELMNVERWSDGGRTLHNVRLYQRAPDSALTTRIVAKEARYMSDGSWMLEDAVVTRVALDEASDRRVATMAWRSRLKPDEVMAVFAPNQSISVTDAIPRLTGHAPANKTPAFYRTRIQRTLASPLAAVVMLILAASAGLGGLRSGQAGRLLVFGLASGVLYLVIDGLLTTLGQVNVFPSVVAAWAAPILFTAVGVTALLNLEG